MGRTFVTATIYGPRRSKEYSFLVDTGSVYVGLPAEEIAELGLRQFRNGSLTFMTANGVVELETYHADGEVQGREFGATVITTPVPLVGYEFLENRRFRVNPVTEQIEPVPEGESALPLLMYATPAG